MRGLVVREQREDEVESLRAQRSRFPNRKEPVTDPSILIRTQIHKRPLIILQEYAYWAAVTVAFKFVPHLSFTRTH